ncbi:ATP-binding cassette domain-containing protein [Nocardioides KLBMP 9356]|uniref:ATP-binding cassette domain-containing protein n=1 Tax=Nocardioides potassii TaxID=2911371 RepID=A0ABS9HDK8_9ACTN|nr:ATP-binding cassette domain-containing protein [Nocardioides potassii]MCF6379277.1 ATP-binding cassette domain-containing protein [Nocardioides potassii]
MTLPPAPPRDRAFGHDALVVCDNVVRIYQTETVEVQALQGLDLLVDRGELIAVVGASGSGKSTLLNVLAGTDAPTAGKVRVAGHDLTDLTRTEQVHYRRHVVGFVRQQAARNLVPYLTAAQVVQLPMTIAGTPARTRATRADELLDLLGVAHCRDRRPVEMSGGEQQRVSIAVALANDPQLLLADEPTGELDSETAAEVFSALRTVNRELGATVVVVTHDAAVSGQVARTVAIRDGRTSSEVLRSEETDGAPATAEEYAVMDRAGRVQLPREYREALALTRRVRLALAADHVEIRSSSDRDGDA